MGSNLQYQRIISLLYFFAQASTDMYVNNDSKSKVIDNDKVLDVTITIVLCESTNTQISSKISKKKWHFTALNFKTCIK